MDNKRKASYAFFSLKWRKRGPWDKKGDLKGTQIHKKVPCGTRVPYKGTQMGTVAYLLSCLPFLRYVQQQNQQGMQYTILNSGLNFADC